jgi:hypothetical protein
MRFVSQLKWFLITSHKNNPKIVEVLFGYLNFYSYVSTVIEREMKDMKDMKERLRDMKTIQVKLQYITNTGFEWLEETVEVNEFNYMNVISNYVEKNQQKANELENKWQSDGEEVELSLDVEPINTDFSNELFKKVYIYVDNL